MKKTIKNLVCLLCILAMSMTLMVGCNKSDKNTKIGFNDLCDRSVVSGIGILAGDSATATLDTMNITLISEEEDNEEETEPEKKEENTEKPEKVTLSEETKAEILKNLAIAESTIAGGVVKSETKEVNEKGYKYLYTLTTTDIMGAKQTYEFYYSTKEEVELDEDDEDEEEIHLEGIVIMNGVEYKVTGEKETEKDEVEISFKISLDENHYVEIEQEVEEGETSYKYSSYENGKLVFESEVEYEVDEKGNIELSFETENNGEEMEYSYEWKTVDGVKYIAVEIEKNEEEFETLIKVTANADGKPVYEFQE